VGWPGCAPLGRTPVRAWTAGGDPDVELLVMDADATLVLAHGDHREGAAGTYKRPSQLQRTKENAALACYGVQAS
jgi:hypothetical protein